MSSATTSSATSAHRTHSSAPRPSPGRSANDETAHACATERVLRRITELYEGGLSCGAVGAVGLKAIADSPLLRPPGSKPMRKPRKKITVMIVGNHSAGKSSFINWYIGQDVQKTGVAIETRGFTFVTSGRRRETLSGDATLRYFDYLDDLGQFPGILPNLSTEVSPSKAKSFVCTDLIDTPGLVDGDMQYPFDVQEAICHMADHVDLILVFFDPIGQATCKRTMQIVERLNHSEHVEKLHYFMSKADAVAREHDRQRVLIQITQNLATRIRNSHAFNLPTFYLPHEDGSDPGIPNAIEEVCQQVDKSIGLTVQKNLRQLKDDCDKVLHLISAAAAADAARRAANATARTRGAALYLSCAALLSLMAALLAARLLPGMCGLGGGGVWGALGGLWSAPPGSPPPKFCTAPHARVALGLRDVVAENFATLFAVLVPAAAAVALAARLLWRTSPTYTKAQLRTLDEYTQVVRRISEHEGELYEDYFRSLSHADDR